MSLEYRDEVETQAEAQSSVNALRIPLPYYTIILLISMAAVFVVQLLTDINNSALTAGLYKPEVIYGNEYWRLLTGAALHGSLLHIFMNGYALYNFGRLMELLANRAHLAIVFLLSAIGGGILSTVLSPEGLSVGASGGIVGLIGYLVIYAFRRRQFISAEFRKSLLINIGFILIFGLVLYKVIDNYGHIGGLLTGIIYGVFQIPSDTYENPQNASGATKVLGVAALLVYILTCAFAIYRILSVVS